MNVKAIRSFVFFFGVSCAGALLLGLLAQFFGYVPTEGDLEFLLIALVVLALILTAVRSRHE